MSNGARILIVDDEPAIRRFLKTILSAHGYTVFEATRGEEAISQVTAQRPDVIVLDLGLPDMDGVQVTRIIREWSQTPIIILSVRDGEADKIAALDAGADDYLTKPFNSQELLARVRVLLRRSQRHEEIMTAPRQCGEIEMDLTRYTLRVRGEPVALTRTEFALLRELMLNANRVVLHQTLLTRVWGAEYRNDMDYLRAYVRYLRRKIERDPAQPQYILTASGIGYMLQCPNDAPPAR